MNDDKTPLVSIVGLTYNQAPYIRECLDGFLMQKTDFPIEVIIHDDASTDGTTDIVKEYASKYPDIIKPIIQSENQYSKHHDFNIIMMSCLEKATGKYIALCEGDDYWTDPLKLQKQVDFLESHPDYGLVHTNYNRLNQSSGKIDKNFGDNYTIRNGNVFELLIKHRFIKTLTALFRASLISSMPKLPDGAFSGDMYIFYEIASKSKIHYINEPMCMYRLLKESASHIADADKILAAYNSYEILDIFYLKKNKSNQDLVKYALQKWGLLRIKLFISGNRYNEFIEEYKRLPKPVENFPLSLVISLSKYKPFFHITNKVWKVKKRLQSR